MCKCVCICVCVSYQTELHSHPVSISAHTAQFVHVQQVNLAAVTTGVGRARANANAAPLMAQVLNSADWTEKRVQSTLAFMAAVKCRIMASVISLRKKCPAYSIQ